LRATLPDVIVRIAGRMEPALEVELQHYPNVEAIPNPPEMEPHLAAATVVAAPIIASSGTRLRILEAWAAGRAVMTTSAGAFGLSCVSGQELMIRDEPPVFAKTLISMLGSSALRSALTNAALLRVEDYDWRSIGSVLLGAYERIAFDAPLRRVETVSGDDAAVLSGKA
jgi:polysaccharide biosynthesis protein PslH